MGCETWKNFSVPPTRNDKVPALAPVTPEQTILDLLDIQEHPHECVPPDTGASTI